MKCKALLYKEIRGQKKPKEKIISIIPRPQIDKIKYPYPKEKYVECGGQIIVDLSIDSYGGCSCCSTSSLEVSYVCSVCGCPEYARDRNLPSDIDAIEEFINKHLESVE